MNHLTPEDKRQILAQMAEFSSRMKKIVTIRDNGERVRALLALQKELMYKSVDYRISKGHCKPEDREAEFIKSTVEMEQLWREHFKPTEH